jgi:hypothetical protein
VDSGRVSDLVVQHLKLDRREFAESALPSSAVVGALDPGDDRGSELVPGFPSLAVEDVLLQAREERLHWCVVAARAGAAHRPDQAVVVESSYEGVRTELATPVRVRNGADWAAEGDGVAQRRDGERGLHPGVHGIADDLAGADVADRAEVELAFVGGVFGDVG